MKLKFKKQQFQSDAVQSTVDLFKGQQSSVSTFTINTSENGHKTVFEGMSAYGNSLTLSSDEIESNLHAVQERNILPLTELKQLRFNIEMETGTGKTFVYIKTIYELNKLYGFNKFVILVPSVAIREGVHKSLQVTSDYFKKEYDGKKANYFIYNSKKRNEVRDFALSTGLEIMIVNIDAIKKDANLFNTESDKMDKTAREFMAECSPIMIIDEPQSIDNTELSRKAIENLNPLCELRYSATHKEKVNTIYRLTPVDAYQINIVKQICVANQSVIDDFNKPYIRLMDVGKNSKYFAKVEVDALKKDGKVVRKIITVNPNASLELVTGRDIYQGYDVAGINLEEGFEEIEFTSGDVIGKGQAIGEIDMVAFKREQIKRTVEIHLDKELKYISRGIKVLSLFFIDEVAKYRVYEGEDTKGLYAKQFEEIYNHLISLPKYTKVREFYSYSAADVHDGYFSKDKKGNIKNTKGETSDDYSTYNTIMRDKEWLLSFECPLRFIFSHSALKEGWDNPNVFQICTLIENKTEFTCRQKIGRGLRLCVDQTGERVDDKNLNILHVVTQEGFGEFASKLQTEYEDIGVKFGVVEIDMFTNIAYKDNNGADSKFSYDDSVQILEHFKSKGYIDNDGKMNKSLKEDLATGTVDLPERFEKARDRLIPILLSADKKVDIKSMKDQVSVKRKDDVFMSPAFNEIWDKMKQKTIYRINMNIDDLMSSCIKEIFEMPKISKSRILKEVANFNIEKSGIEFKEGGVNFAAYEQEILLPDVVRILSETTKLPRSNVGKILLECGRLQDFLNNPQKFIEAVTKIIKTNRIEKSIDGIKYQVLDGEEYTFYEAFSFDQEGEIIAFIDSNAIAVKNSVYDHVIYDNSKVERDFASDLDDDPDVKLFFKIPNKFKISTPVSNYTPDWAVYLDDGITKKMYFVIETKGSTDRLELRGAEYIKKVCGTAHFEAIGSSITYELDTKWKNLKKNI